MSRIRNWFSQLLGDSNENRLDFPPMENLKFPDDVHILLVGFSYDTPTKQTYTWIENVLSESAAQHRVLRFHNEGLAKSILEATLVNIRGRIEIFCGHGSSEGLYGPPFLATLPMLLKDRHSIFYNIGMITPGPSSMFAFCCGAANKFGRMFAAQKGNLFIGFKGDLPFPQELYGDLKYVFQIVAKDIIERGKIESTHEKMFIQEIDKLIDTSGKYKNPTLAEIWLEEYKYHFRAFV